MHLTQRMMESFENNNKDGASLITPQSTEMILKGIEKCVDSQEAAKHVAEVIIEEMKGNVGVADHGRLLKQLQLFLFLLKREIQDVLRNRSIKPHWMFALDDMISKAVQAILQQMGMSFDDEGEPEKREYTSQTSTSAGSSGRMNFVYDNALVKLAKVQGGNAELLNMLIMAEERYQNLLKQTLGDRQQQIRLLELQHGGSVDLAVSK